MYNDRHTRRYNRRMNRYRNPMRGLATGIFFIFLAFAFYFSKSFDSHLFLPILFAGLAFCCLFGAASSGDPRGIYGGLYPFVWLLGLALCFLIGFWPWILLPIGVSMILGALYNPITSGLSNSGFMANQYPPQPKQQYDLPEADSAQQQELPPQQQ